MIFIFNYFYDLLKNRIFFQLRKILFCRFRGGLDVTSDDTGEETVYEEHDDSQIMFHVSTLLPHSNKDQQQLERKRHIGNDRVVIVFQDKTTPFSTAMIKSKLLHVFIIIQPVKNESDTETKGYKVCSLKKDYRIMFLKYYVKRKKVTFLSLFSSKIEKLKNKNERILRE